MNRIAAILLLLAPACASSARQTDDDLDPDDWRREHAEPHGVVVTGMFGLGELEVTDVELDSSLGDVDDTDDASLPTIGAVVQKPMVGRRLRLGLEGGGTLGWDGDVEAIIVGSGGAILAAENDFLLADLFCGAFADLALGERVRLYAGVGPLLQFASVDAEWNDPLLGDVDLSEDGFGGGYYARTGFEIALGSGLSLGLGVRFVDSSFDLGGQIDEVEFEELQYLLTATREM
jgi:opacity protein-like surface antigen